MLKIEPSKLSLICKQIFKEIQMPSSKEPWAVKKRKKFYETWKSDNLPQIEKAFQEKGFFIKGFKELGRRIKKGEKGLYIKSEKTYPFHYYLKGVKQKDENGKPIIRECSKGYCLFHVNQTLLVEE